MITLERASLVGLCWIVCIVLLGLYYSPAFTLATLALIATCVALGVVVVSIIIKFEDRYDE